MSDEPTKQRNQNPIVKSVLGSLSLLAGVALFASLLVLGGAEMRLVLVNAELVWTVLAFAASLLLYPLAAWRWSSIVNAMEGREVAPVLLFLKMRLVLAAGGFLGPRDLVEMGGRALWLSRNCGLSMSRAVKAVFIDRFCDIIVSLASLAGALTFWILGWPVEAAGGLVLGGAIFSVLILPVMFPVIERLLEILAAADTPLTRSKRVRDFIERLISALTLPANIWRRALFLTFLKWIILVFRAVALAWAVDLGLSWALVVLASPVGQLANIIAITPGGFGIYDAGWFGILVHAGALTGDAVAFVVLLRLSILVSIFGWTPLLGFHRSSLKTRLDRGKSPNTKDVS